MATETDPIEKPNETKPEPRPKFITCEFCECSLYPTSGELKGALSPKAKDLKAAKAFKDEYDERIAAENRKKKETENEPSAPEPKKKPAFFVE